MKKSKRLAAVLTEINKPRFDTATDRRLADWLSDPANWSEPVYAWLWTNYDQVLELRARLDGLTWDGIARIMVEDGVKGSRGEAPNANSVRRVWGRVQRDKARRETREGIGE